MCISCVLQAFHHGSQDSLEKRASLGRKSYAYDAAVFDVLRVSPDDFAVSRIIAYLHDPKMLSLESKWDKYMYVTSFQI